MSAYVVDRNHISYLMAAAMSRVITNGRLGWRTPGGEWQTLDVGDIEKAAVVGQMLWEENIRSVLSRYPRDTRETMPGPVGESFEFTEKDVRIFRHIEPIQVIKACHCFAYQSCEHTEWEKSEACSFLNALESIAVRSLPGYEKAEWGAPELKKSVRTI